MSSLADAPDLVGFFSYSREDDEGSGGRLSKLRERIQEELRGQLGRTKRDFRLWQDKVAIAHGELWEDTIKRGISESVFFIPIITPTAVKSRFCKFEFETFLAREKELGRSNLVFPILYIPVPELADDGWRRDPLLETIGSRQYERWQNLRHLDPSSTEVALRVEKFCENICKALKQPWLSPQERQEAEARRAAEEERRRQEKLQEEARQRAEDERRRQERLQEEARQRAEKERRREEAQTKRRLDEAAAEKRKLEKEAAWAAKKERLHRWRGAAAAGAAVVALLMVGGIWLYRTTTPAGVTSAVVQPDAPSAEKAKAAAEAEARAKAEQAEKDRLAAAQAEEQRKALERSSALVNQGITDTNNHDYDRAIAALSEAMRLDPKSARVFSFLGTAYMRKGDNDRAIADYNEAIRLDPMFGFAFHQRGVAYMRKGDNDRGIADYDEAIRLNYKPALAFLNRGTAYMNKGDNDRAIADFDEAIRTGFMRKGDDDKAIANDNRAIRLNPGAPEYLDAARAFLSRGVAYARKGDARRAIADFDEAIRLNPSYALAFCNRGIAKLKINEASGNEDKAKARELNASSCP